MGDFARRAADEWLVVRHMDDDLVVYDTRTQRVSALNPLATGVWRACDGHTSAENISAALQGAGMDIATPAAVKDALAKLAAAELVEFPEGQAERKSDAANRREALRRLFAGGAVVGGAAVVSLVAPQPAHASSGYECNTDDECEEYNFEFCNNHECWGPF